MSKGDEQDHYSIYLKELNQKLDELERNNLKLKTEVNFKHEDNMRLNDELTAKVEEMKYYEGIVKKSDVSIYDDTKSVDNLLTSRRDKEESERDMSLDQLIDEEHKKIEEEEEDDNIVSQMESLLKEVNNSMNDTQPITHAHIQQSESFHLYCRAVLVVFIDPESVDDCRKVQHHLQTFKIDLNTTFTELREAILNFWDLKDRENEFSLQFFDKDEEISDIKDNSELIDAFLKGKSNIEKAKFLFVVNKIKNINELKRIEELKEKENSKISNKFTIDSSTEKFFSKFLGLTNYLQKKLVRIKKKLEDQDQINVKKGGLLKAILMIFHFACLVVFTVFTILSLLYKCPPDQTFYLNRVVKKGFSPDSVQTGYLSKYDIKNDIIKRVAGVAIDGDLLPYANMVSPMRISFYRVTENPNGCKYTDKVCYYNVYQQSTSATKSDTLTYFLGSGVADYLKFGNMTNSEYPQKFYIEASSSGGNYVQDYNSLRNYYTSIMTSLSNVNTDSSYSQLIYGKLAYYLGMGYDLMIDIDKVNTQVLETALDITYLDSKLWDQGLRAVVVTFAFYHFTSDFYYYITIMYELSSDGSVLPTELSVNYFLTNLYSGTQGQRLRIMDVVRMLISLFLIFFILKDIIIERKEIYKNNPNANLFHVIFRFKTISEFFVVILYCFSFSIKNIYLHDTTYTYWSVSIDNGWLTTPRDEFFFTLYWFTNDNVIESVIFFIIIWRFFMTFFRLKRIRNLAFFYYHSFIKISTFMVILFAVFIAFSVLANNVFGSHIEEFQNLPSSITYVLLLTIGHFPGNINKSGQNGCLCIFFFLLCIFIIYFFLSTFVGIYLESFRITSIRKGYSFDKKSQDSQLLINYFKRKDFNKLKGNQTGGNKLKIDKEPEVKKVEIVDK